MTLLPCTSLSEMVQEGPYTLTHLLTHTAPTGEKQLPIFCGVDQTDRQTTSLSLLTRSKNTKEMILLQL